MTDKPTEQSQKLNFARQPPNEQFDGNSFPISGNLLHNRAGIRVQPLLHDSSLHILVPQISSIQTDTLSLSLFFSPSLILSNLIMSRSLPNIIITGTPGTGKTTHCEVLAEKCPELKHLSVNQVVKDKECHEGWDDEYQSWIVDEDKVRLLLRLVNVFLRHTMFMTRLTVLSSCWMLSRTSARQEAVSLTGTHVIYFLGAGSTWWLC